MTLSFDEIAELERHAEPTSWPGSTPVRLILFSLDGENWSSQPAAQAFGFEPEGLQVFSLDGMVVASVQLPRSTGDGSETPGRQLWVGTTP